MGHGDDAWLVAHACVARGDQLLIDGASAIDVLIDRFGVRDREDGSQDWGFPPPIDPHGYSYIAEMTWSGADLNRRTRGRGVHRGEFVRGCSSVVSWAELPIVRELAWPLAAMHVEPRWWSPPPAGTRVEDVVNRGIDAYEAAMAELFDPDLPRGTVPSRIATMSCGGRHLLFALWAAVSETAATCRSRQRVEALLQLEPKRVRRELEIAAQWSGGDELRLLAARSQILGHSVEVLGFSLRTGADPALRGPCDEFLEMLRDDTAHVTSAGDARQFLGEVFRDFYAGVCHGTCGLRQLRLYEGPGSPPPTNRGSIAPESPR